MACVSFEIEYDEKIREDAYDWPKYNQDGRLLKFRRTTREFSRNFTQTVSNELNIARAEWMDRVLVYVQQPNQVVSNNIDHTKTGVYFFYCCAHFFHFFCLFKQVIKLIFIQEKERDFVFVEITMKSTPRHPADPNMLEIDIGAVVYQAYKVLAFSHDRS